MTFVYYAIAMTLCHYGVTAFFPAPILTVTGDRSRPLHVSWWDKDDESRQAALQNNIMRTDVRNFLTQRSLQSFISLCIACRDPHTVGWLEDFGGWDNFENFHGTGGLNTTLFPTWSSVLTEILEQPQETIVVKVARNTGGGSIPGSAKKRRKNPYLEDQFTEINIDIDPTSVANRILSVREQIANEWVCDLETLKVSNDMILKTYNEKIEEERKKQSEEEEDNAMNNHPKVDFERDAVTLLRGSEAFADKDPSPLRHANFDLLALLLTQESIHRVLRDYLDAGKEREVSFRWFREYYTERVVKYFDGEQEFGRADDFLGELLSTPPSIKTDAGTMDLVDPLRVAEDILAVRSDVAMEWKVMMEEVKEDHVEIRRLLLNSQMVKWGHKPVDKTETSKKGEKEKESDAPSPQKLVARPSKEEVISKDEVIGEFQ
mmetsp:Transcript_33456/g.50471  ORF Transcript_33456/g.50471 Transcript_33456/m.50471 type:complete len:433 (+) Transcript_33456:174-1472(+)|eukprot:CAMPEP_0178916258 /NCGR_PEP_ID=MMETSP0786-20121207/12517_1 /TAXON_ID=186022 /ORGANISM="Thalassionema frauenfeldii, Strain CCMP 1798" /LENGTH=432 /DNA_ID=CAMNT_0020589529 /DNA_START=153 /DNA_END=1451 /DNA_ORIENTATION=+